MFAHTKVQSTQRHDIASFDPVSTLDASKHVLKITKLCKSGLNWSSKLQEDNERKTTSLYRNVCFQMREKGLIFGEQIK